MKANVKKDLQEEVWSSLPYEAWKDTLDTLHMWMQVVGKVKLALAPFINQWWEVAFYVTATGVTSGRIPYKHGAFAVTFDFLHHTLTIDTSTNKSKTIVLIPRSVADFYREFMDALESVEIHVTIKPVPTEVPDPIPFPHDTRHASYDKEYVTRWWRILLQSSLVFDRFRSPFRGKSSSIQFFWGSFDLSGTRFSGRSSRFMRNACNPRTDNLFATITKKQQITTLGLYTNGLPTRLVNDRSGTIDSTNLSIFTRSVSCAITTSSPPFLILQSPRV